MESRNNHHEQQNTRGVTKRTRRATTGANANIHVYTREHIAKETYTHTTSIRPTGVGFIVALTYRCLRHLSPIHPLATSYGTTLATNRLQFSREVFSQVSLSRSEPCLLRFLLLLLLLLAS